MLTLQWQRQNRDSGLQANTPLHVIKQWIKENNILSTLHFWSTQEGVRFSRWFTISSTSRNFCFWPVSDCVTSGTSTFTFPSFSTASNTTFKCHSHHLHICKLLFITTLIKYILFLVLNYFREIWHGHIEQKAYRGDVVRKSSNQFCAKMVIYNTWDGDQYSVLLWQKLVDYVYRMTFQAGNSLWQSVAAESMTISGNVH